jgi:hypothetical protein
MPRPGPSPRPPVDPEPEGGEEWASLQPGSWLSRSRSSASMLPEGEAGEAWL